MTVFREGGQYFVRGRNGKRIPIDPPGYYRKTEPADGPVAPGPENKPASTGAESRDGINMSPAEYLLKIEVYAKLLDAAVIIAEKNAQREPRIKLQAEAFRRDLEGLVANGAGINEYRSFLETYKPGLMRGYDLLWNVTDKELSDILSALRLERNKGYKLATHGLEPGLTNYNPGKKN